MAWVKLDDGFVGHSKVVKISDRAFRLYVAALCHCARRLTDGALTGLSVTIVCAEVAATKRHVAELAAVGLWVPAEDGYSVKNFVEYNPSAETVEANRKKRAAAGRAGAEKRWGTRNGKDDGKPASEPHSGSHDEPHSEPDGDPHIPRPVPLRPSRELALPSYEGGPDEKLWTRLVTAAGASDAGSVRKLERAVTANKCSERDLVCAIEAADGPGVRDRLAVALSELVRRAGERAA